MRKPFNSSSSYASNHTEAVCSILTGSYKAQCVQTPSSPATTIWSSITSNNWNISYSNGWYFISIGVTATAKRSVDLATWVDFSCYPEYGQNFAIDPLNTNNILQGCITSGIIMYTTNGGTSWNSWDTGKGSTTNTVFYKDSKWYTVDLLGNTLYSTTLGGTWTDVVGAGNCAYSRIVNNKVLSYTNTNINSFKLGNSFETLSTYTTPVGATVMLAAYNTSTNKVLYSNNVNGTHLYSCDTGVDILISGAPSMNSVNSIGSIGTSFVLSYNNGAQSLWYVVDALSSSCYTIPTHSNLPYPMPISWDENIIVSNTGSQGGTPSGLYLLYKDANKVLVYE